MIIIDDTNPRHKLAWRHVYDGRHTVFACSCGGWQRKIDTPCTMHDATFQQRVAVEDFNGHLDSLTPVDPTAPVDAVIISETPHTWDFEKENALNFVGKTDHKGRKVEGDDPRTRDESFWRDAQTGQHCASEGEYTKTQNFGGPPHAAFDAEFTEQAMGARFTNINEQYGKFGVRPPMDGTEFDERIRRGATSFHTVIMNNNQPADALTVEKIEKIFRDVRRKYPHMRK